MIFRHLPHGSPSLARLSEVRVSKTTPLHLHLTNESRSSFGNLVRIGSKKSSTCTWLHVRNSSIDGSIFTVDGEAAAEYRFVGVVTSFPWCRFGGGMSSCTAASTLWPVSDQYSLYLVHIPLTYKSFYCFVSCLTPS